VRSFFWLPTILLITSAQSAIAQSYTRARLTSCDPKALVCQTDQYYDPAQYNDDYSPPTCQPAADTYKKAVQSAFDAAPPGVKTEICKLKNIIVQTAPNTYSWGFWENPFTKPKGQQKSYIGIRSDYFGFTLAQEEDATEKIVLQHTNLSFSHKSTNDSAALGLLAVIAHEIGHILWHRDNVYLPTSPLLQCYVDSFVGPLAAPKSWKRDAGLQQTLIRSWHPPPNDATAPGNADYDNTVPNPIRRPPSNANQLSKIIEKGFVTPFASISPEEDFVETYKLLAVASGTPKPTLTLEVTQPGRASISLLPADPNNSTTQGKLACVRRLM
jgi:hypothetical protein